MANVKITELTAQTTTADATDVVPIVDVAANATKKITVANLITAQARTVYSSTAWGLSLIHI